MPAIEVNSNALLDALKQLAPAELDAFIDEALALRQQPQAHTLSAD